MTSNNQTKQEALRAKIEEEKRTDKWIKRVNKSAWIVTILFLFGFSAIKGYDIYHAHYLYKSGLVSVESVYDTILPFVTSVGAVSFIIAIVSTIGVFFRLRTATLSEILMRITVLEEVLLNENETKA